MGILLSRFRSKLSTKEVLEEIDKELKSIDEFQQDTIERQKRMARRLLVIFIVVYIIAIAAFIFISSIQKYKLYYFTGLVTFAIVAWILNKGSRWYFNRQMVTNSEKSVELRKRKKKILEEVMDTETYKVAKEILDRFGDKPQTSFEIKAPQTPSNLIRPSAPGTELRHRQVEQQRVPMSIRANAPMPPNTPANISNPNQLQHPNHNKPQQQPQMLSTQRPVAMNYGHAPMRPLPRPILPRERGVLDRMMDLFVGDGPHQRYALICRHCSGHNGMALQEEFEFVSYYCCYCYQFNPPRKMRPMGPRLPVPPPPIPMNSPVKVTDDKKTEHTSEKDEKSEKSKSDDSGDEASDTESDLLLSSNKIKHSDSEDSENSEEMEVDTPMQEEKAISDNGQDTSSLC